MAVTQYIGARYVPVFAEPIEWDITKTYEPLTIVSYQGNSYTSKQAVPSQIAITNEDFWALTGNYNAQIEQYRTEVEQVKQDVAGFDDKIEPDTTQVFGKSAYTDFDQNPTGDSQNLVTSGGVFAAIETVSQTASAASQTATEAKADAEQAQADATQAQTDATQAKTDAAQAKTDAAQANETANTAQTTASAAQATATEVQNFLKITQKGTSGLSGMNASGNLRITTATLNWALNASGTWGKFYGFISCTNADGTNETITINPNIIPFAKPSADWVLGYTVFAWTQTANQPISRMSILNLTIKTDGSISINVPSTPSAGDTITIFIPALTTWFTDFGDTDITALMEAVNSFSL